MGFHICEYCTSGAPTKIRFKNSSSGDVILSFSSGRSWMMPDMVLHYVADHQWRPPEEFITDVLTGSLVEGSDRMQTRRLQTKSLGENAPTMIGYLRGDYEKGPVPKGFIEKLKDFMAEAARRSGYPNVKYEHKEADHA